MFNKWFKEQWRSINEVDKLPKEQEDIKDDGVAISYSGKHKFYIPSEPSILSNFRYGIYLDGSGNANARINNQLYSFNDISIFAYLKDADSKALAYREALEMDGDIIMEALKKEVVKRISYEMENMNLLELEKALKDKKVNLSFEIQVKKSDILRK